jgi:hypothetical protein
MTSNGATPLLVAEKVARRQASIRDFVLFSILYITSSYLLHTSNLILDPVILIIFTAHP